MSPLRPESDLRVPFPSLITSVGTNGTLEFSSSFLLSLDILKLWQQDTKRHFQGRSQTCGVGGAGLSLGGGPFGSQGIWGVLSDADVSGEPAAVWGWFDPQEFASPCPRAL